MDEDRFFFLNRGDLEKRLDPFYYIPSLVALEEQVLSNNALPLRSFVKKMASGATPTVAEFDKYYSKAEEGHPFIRVQNLSETGVLSLDDVKYINDFTQKVYLKRSQVEENDLVTKITGVGRMAVSSVPPIGFKGNINQHSVVIKTESREISEYLAAYLNSDIGEKLATRRSTGGTRPALDYPALRSIPVICNEEIFNKAREAREEREQKENQAQELLASIDDYLLNELGINLPPEPENTIENRKFRTEWANVTGNRFDPDYYSDHYQNKIESIENGVYTTQPLSQVTDLVLNGKTPSSDSYSDTETNYPIIKVGSYTGNYIDLDKISYSKNPLSRFVKQGDIFILSAAHQAQYVGRHIKLLEQTPEIPTSHVGELICVRPDTQQIQPYFLYALLSTEVYKTLINREKTGQTSHVYPSDIRKIRLPIPDLDHQRQMEAEIIRRYNEARDLTASAIHDFQQAKQEIEQLILEPAHNE